MQNFANQFAQMAVGWHIYQEPSFLVDEPDGGAITIDIVNNHGGVNGHSADLGILWTLRNWTQGQLRRDGLSPE